MGCAQRSEPPQSAYSPISHPSSVNLKERGHNGLPRFGPPCGVKPYSCFVVDWPREEVEDELVQWVSSPARAQRVRMDPSPLYGGDWPIFILGPILFPHNLGGKEYHIGQF